MGKNPESANGHQDQHIMKMGRFPKREDDQTRNKRGCRIRIEHNRKGAFCAGQKLHADNGKSGEQIGQEGYPHAWADRRFMGPDGHHHPAIPKQDERPFSESHLLLQKKHGQNGCK